MNERDIIQFTLGELNHSEPQYDLERIVLSEALSRVPVLCKASEDTTPQDRFSDYGFSCTVSQEAKGVLDVSVLCRDDCDTASLIKSLFDACEGSFVVYDPYGQLSEQYGQYFISRGYEIHTIDFEDEVASDKIGLFTHFDLTDIDNLAVLLSTYLAFGDRYIGEAIIKSVLMFTIEQYGTPTVKGFTDVLDALLTKKTHIVKAFLASSASEPFRLGICTDKKTLSAVFGQLKDDVVPKIKGYCNDYSCLDNLLAQKKLALFIRNVDFDSSFLVDVLLYNFIKGIGNEQEGINLTILDSYTESRYNNRTMERFFYSYPEARWDTMRIIIHNGVFSLKKTDSYILATQNVSITEEE